MNSPLGHCHHESQAVSSFVKVDPQLQHMVENFYSHNFPDSFADDMTEMLQDERCFMQSAEKYS